MMIMDNKHKQTKKTRTEKKARNLSNIDEKKQTKKNAKLPQSFFFIHNEKHQKK